jgi:multidrug efflux pump subunit AcrA (membrane-fusion protein)
MKRNFIRVEGFNTQEPAFRRGSFRALKKGIKPRIQIPYENNIPRPFRAGLLIFLLILGLGILAGCGKAEEKTPPDTQPRVRASPVVAREIAGEVSGFGFLSFLKKIDLAAPSEGVLETLYFREGDFISRGNIAAVLKNPQITLAVRRAENAFSQAGSALKLAEARLLEGEFSAEARLLENEKDLAELEEERKALEEQRRKQWSEEALFEAGGVSVEAIHDSRFALEASEARCRLMEKALEIRRIGLRPEDLAAAGVPIPPDNDGLRRALIGLAVAGLRAEKEAAQANLSAAEKELESCLILESELIIRSPGSGTIGGRYFEEGERVKGEDKILTLIDTGSLYAVFSVSETEALKLSRGMAATVSLDGTGGVYSGKVDLVSPQADSQSFTFTVRVLLPADREGLLKPGMFARVKISLEEKQKITLIPEAALKDKKENRGTVFTVKGNTLSERSVVLGRMLGDEREIISGLVPGEVVVLRPVAALQDGVYVSVAD